MGVSGFLSFLKKKVPHIIREEPLNTFAYQRVFIDISGYLYRYLCTIGRDQHRWIGALLHFLSTFREFRVIPIPVFDGKPPVEKDQELQERREKRSTLQSRIETLRNALHKYQSDTSTDESMAVLQEELQRLDVRGKRMASLLNTKSSSKISSSDIELLQQTLDTMKRQFIYISEEDRILLKEVFTACGITWIQSPSESESYCSYLTRQGLGCAVLSGDSDCLAHLANDWILDVKPNGMCTHIILSEVLRELEITEEELVDYAILMGCDYNRHTKTHKLGPVTALKLIHEYHSIEQIPDQLINKDCLSYVRCRELFCHPFDPVVIPYVSPNPDAIQMLQDLHQFPPSFFQRILRPLSSPSTLAIEEE
jgi:5'-3' exonuclease